MLKKISSLLLFPLLILQFGCGSSSDGTGGGNNSITFGQVIDGTSQISIPEKYFNSSANLSLITSGSSVEVFQEGEGEAKQIEDAESNLSNGMVQFNVDDLSEGDSLSIVLKIPGEKEQIYAATVSETAEKAVPLTDCETTTNAAKQLICATCERVSGCGPVLGYSLSLEPCVSGLLVTSQLGDEFGVPIPENSLSTLAIAERVDDGTFVADATKLAACLNQIAGIVCTGSPGTDVNSGYEASSPNNFENIENIFPEDFASDCDEVFGGTP